MKNIKARKKSQEAPNQSGLFLKDFAFSKGKTLVQTQKLKPSSASTSRLENQEVSVDSTGKCILGETSGQKTFVLSLVGLGEGCGLPSDPGNLSGGQPPRNHWDYCIGVRAWLACGYFIPGGASQRGGGQAPMFPCRTLSDLDYPGLRSVTCDVSSRWVLTTVQ